MSLVKGIKRPIVDEAVAEEPLFDGVPLIFATAAICAFFVYWRSYEQDFGQFAGLDSFVPKFTARWMTILYFEEPVELISFLAMVGWMWKTRDQDVANIHPREEMRRIFSLLSWILVYGVAIYWGLSFFTEQSATWYVATVRDSDFTPSDIITFYMSYPMYIVVGVGGFMYARTRLPTFACKGWSIAYVLLFVGPFMIFPAVGLNQWGHTFWFMEELFVAPSHWMFVFFGWFSLAVFGVTLQILGRVVELCAGYEEIVGLVLDEEQGAALKPQIFHYIIKDGYKSPLDQHSDGDRHEQVNPAVPGLGGARPAPPSPAPPEGRRHSDGGAGFDPNHDGESGESD